MEIERLRKKAAEREAKLQEEKRKAAAEVAAAAGGAATAAAAAAAAAEQEAAPDLRDKLSRTLKVSWHRKVRRVGAARVHLLCAGLLKVCTPISHVWWLLGKGWPEGSDPRSAISPLPCATVLPGPHCIPHGQRRRCALLGDTAYILPPIPLLPPRLQGGEYSVESLRAAFSAHGLVEDVVLREGKKKKGSALVVMASQEGAAAAANSACGDLANPLLVFPFPKVRAWSCLPSAAALTGRPPPAGSFIALPAVSVHIMACCACL